MFYAHPNSERVNVAYANWYAESGHFREAYALLARFDGTGFVLNRLYIRCLQNKKLAESDFQNAVGRTQGVIGMYEMSGLINLANLGLDGKCTFPPTLYVQLVDKALTLPISHTISKRDLWIYKAHYLHQAHDYDAAIAALDTCYRVVPGDPLPLFLATEWLLDRGNIPKAREYYAAAATAAKKTGMNYSNLTTPIERRLAESPREDTVR